MKRRIIRADSLNWAIQEYQEGGNVIERGRYAGQVAQAKWKNPEVFYPSLADIIEKYLSEEIGDAVPIGEGVKLDELLTTIQSSKENVRTYVKELLERQETDTLIGILQERGYTVTNGKKGRNSYVEDEQGSEAT